MNRKNDSQVIGCKTHGRTRKGVRKDLHIYGIYRHCYCGHDLQSKWKGAGQWEYSFFEKTYCTPGSHYKEDPGCGYHWRTPCGWHGLSFKHCALCKECLVGEPLGVVNGLWTFGPFNLAKRILRALKNL